jgi:hypothetical protein
MTIPIPIQFIPSNTTTGWSAELNSTRVNLSTPSGTAYYLQGVTSTVAQLSSSANMPPNLISFWSEFKIKSSVLDTNGTLYVEFPRRFMVPKDDAMWTRFAQSVPPIYISVSYIATNNGWNGSRLGNITFVVAPEGSQYLPSDPRLRAPQDQEGWPIWIYILIVASTIMIAVLALVLVRNKNGAGKSVGGVTEFASMKSGQYEEHVCEYTSPIYEYPPESQWRVGTGLTPVPNVAENEHAQHASGIMGEWDRRYSNGTLDSPTPTETQDRHVMFDLDLIQMQESEAFIRTDTPSDGVGRG